MFVFYIRMQSNYVRDVYYFSYDDCYFLMMIVIFLWWLLFSYDDCYFLMMIVIFNDDLFFSQWLIIRLVCNLIIINIGVSYDDLYFHIMICIFIW
jgi:hypothetical protein